MATLVLISAVRFAFLLRFDHMVMIPTNIVGLTNKKKAVKTKNGMAPEELSNVKMDIIR